MSKLKVFLELIYPLSNGYLKTIFLKNSSVIGRQQGCDVQIEDPRVSREHLKVYPEADQWLVEDLGGRNGSYVDGRPFQKIAITDQTTIELGRGGPTVQLRPCQDDESNSSLQPRASKPHHPISSSSQSDSSEEITQHYFDPAYKGPMGKHTQMIRIAFQNIARKQSKRYWWTVALLSVVFLSLGGGGWYYYEMEIEKARHIAIKIFYHMKEIELQVDNLADMLEKAPKSEQTDQLFTELSERKQKLTELTKQYDDFLEKIKPLPEKIKPLIRVFKAQDEDLDSIILRMARLFGECEVDIPADFLAEVKRYIGYWKATPRMENAIRRLREKGYAPFIYDAFIAQQLPPQFLYLSLQESNFQEQIVGPSTRYGYAKGMWQFIPDTGMRYGLQIGPLKDSRQYDPQDERHDPRKASMAAAKYIKYIYRTDAQASGLLVMASYNWGEGNIIRLIRQMPANPRERNFWQLLKQHRIPKETYDYVFYIFSASVIGENPKLFGFSFDNPLKELISAVAAQ